MTTVDPFGPSLHRWSGSSVAELAQEYRAAGAWDGRSINERLAAACNESIPDSRLVVVSGERPASITFRDLRQAALSVAAGLRRLGVGPGSRVAMQLPNWLEACLLHHAVTALGATLVPILHLYRAREVERIVQVSRAEVVVVARSWMGLDLASPVEALCRQLATVRTVVVVGEERPAGTSVAFEALCAHEALSEDECVDDPDAPNIIAFTSGVTGAPKGVVHSQNTMLAATRAMVSAFGGPQPQGDVGMNPNPVGHGTGVFATFVVPFLYDFRAMVLLDRWDADEMLDLVATEQVTLVGGAPVFLNAMLRSSRIDHVDTSSLRAFLLGGDVVPPVVVENAADAGWTALRAYGLTEQPSISMGRPDDPLPRRAHTDGRLVDLTDVRIVSEGRDVGPGEEGEIWARGPGQCIGLVDGDDVVPATPDGWVRTGDLGCIDGDGYLRISGRMKDVIIRGGEKISCAEVEEVLLRHPDVVDVAVAGLPDPFAGQKVAAFVVARRGCAPHLQDVARHCVAAGLARHKVPKRLHVVDEVPRSLLGKVQRYHLVASALSSAPPAPTGVAR